MGRFAMIVKSRRAAAYSTALVADAIQIVFLPFFAPGLVSPWDDALDVAVGAVLIALLGWHWAFAPTFVAEVVPGLDLVPTWTAAVFLATRSRSANAPSHFNLK